ncbi:MAG: TMEM175 family protein [Methanobacteriaceae archaeon]|nr:TMEM175 family protein [Methanobacteriaceae archaeon]MDO9627827.1 TMEM175 family protein [Methanobacteriaceae archaeon]
MDKRVKKNLKEKFMTTNRIETLVDGIFAIAMTLLVLTLEVPQLPAPVTNGTIINFLISTIPQFFVYGMSFVLLAVFWRINHREFHRIEKSNGMLLRINVIWLMFVVLVPFSTSLVGDYGNFQAAELFFHLNMLIIGILAFINWYYAVNWGLTNVKWTKKAYKSSFYHYLIFPFLAVVAMLLTFISPSFSSLAYLGIVFFENIGKKINPDDE